METQAVTTEDPMVDPITGEIIEDHDIENATLEQLPRFGRAIASIDKKINHRREAVEGCTCGGCNLAREIERMEAIREHHIERLREQRENLRVMSESLLLNAGEDKIACPGIGTFRFRKSSAVNTEGFDALDDQGQLALYNRLNSAFITPKPFVPRPDRAQIKKYLKEGAGLPEGFTDAFSIEDRSTFRFEAEK